MRIVDAIGSKFVELGRMGEHQHTTVRFPEAREYLDMYPSATVCVLNKRPGDPGAYPVDPVYIRVENGVVMWDIQNADLIRDGKGQCELVFFQDETIAKSLIYMTTILKSLDGTEEPPEPWEEWVERIVKASENAPYIEDGTWHVWDPAEGGYVDTGIDATGPKGDKGDKGDTGNGIESTVLNNDYTLTINFTSGESYTTRSIRGETGNGIASVVINNNDTMTITFTDGNTYTTIPLRGAKGEKGDPFTVKKTFASIVEMEEYTGTDVVEGDFVMITSTVEDPDNAKLYVKSASGYSFITDLSGTQGMKGDTGNGIASITQNLDYTLTIAYTNGSSITTAPIRGEKGEKGDPGSDSIDDTAGYGDTDKLWSADKIYNELALKATKNSPEFYGHVSLGRKISLGASPGENSVAIGFSVEASGQNSHAEGDRTKAYGYHSHAEGSQCTSSGRSSHAEGELSVAYKKASHAEGNYTTANGDYSHSEGNDTTASGEGSHAEGLGTKASSDYQHVSGRYNTNDNTGRFAEIVGNGSNNSSRANARALDWNGNGYYAGDLYVNSDFSENGGDKVATEDQVNDVLSKLGDVPSGTTVENQISYVDGRVDGLQASIGTVPSGETVQGQIEAIKDSIGTVPTGTTVEGQIASQNETIAKKADIIAVTDSDSATVKTMSDGADGIPMGLTVAVEPVQDLKGYDYPWPAGGGKNLFDADGNVFTVGKVYDENGDLIDNQYVKTSDFISIQPNTPYTVSGTDMHKSGTSSSVGMRMNFFDSSKGFLSRTDGVTSGNVLSATSPATAAFVRFGCGSGAVATSIQFELGSSATDYAPFSNVCPIIGWTGAKVFATRKNLYNKEATDENNGYVYNKYLNAQGALVTPSNAWLVSEYIKVKPGTVYTLQGVLASTSVHCCEYDENKAFLTSHSYATVPLTFTTLENTKYIRLSRKPDSGSSRNPYVQLEEGTTATAYETFGSTYTISFPSEAGTVYGGTLTVNKDGTGILVVDSEMIASYNGETLPGEWISDRDVYESGTTPTTGAQVVYKLSTPSEPIPLTAPQVISLLGINNIFADTGDILSVDYSADTKMYVDNQIAQKVSASQRLMELIVTANREDSMVATEAYSTGDLLIVNGTLYKASTSIANGATLTVGTNVTATTVAAEIAALA